MSVWATSSLYPTDDKKTCPGSLYVMHTLLTEVKWRCTREFCTFFIFHHIKIQQYNCLHIAFFFLNKVPNREHNSVICCLYSFNFLLSTRKTVEIVTWPDLGGAVASCSGKVLRSVIFVQILRKQISIKNFNITVKSSGRDMMIYNQKIKY